MLLRSSSGGSMLGNIRSTIAEGMAVGTGSAIAHRAVDAVMGPRTIQHEAIVSQALLHQHQSQLVWLVLMPVVCTLGHSKIVLITAEMTSASVSSTWICWLNAGETLVL